MDERNNNPMAGYSPIREYMMETVDEESKQRIESDHGLYAEGDGVYLYKKGYKGSPIIFED